MPSRNFFSSLCAATIRLIPGGGMFGSTCSHGIGVVSTVPVIVRIEMFS